MRFLIVAFLSLASCPALALDNTYVGAGNVSCMDWINRGAVMATKMEQEGWVLGYTSGVNARSPKDLLFKSDTVAMLLFVDTYCAVNTEKRLVDAANELLLSLKEKAR
jgi:hypothetical protein